VITEPAAPFGMSFLVPLVLAVFSSAAAAAFVQGVFSRPKVHAEATAALATVEATDASVTEIIQRAAAGLIADLERQLADVRKRLDIAEQRVSTAERRATLAERRANLAERRATQLEDWRREAEALFAKQGTWEREITDRLRALSVNAPTAPPDRASPEPTPPGGVSI
jgi:vacuolar-type H+-ATPase subunit I/STV1